MLKNNKKPTKLKIMLKQMGVTQRALAKAADKEHYQICEYVSGKRTDMLLSTAKKICKVLDCTLDELFADDK